MSKPLPLPLSAIAKPLCKIVPWSSGDGSARYSLMMISAITSLGMYEDGVAIENDGHTHCAKGYICFDCIVLEIRHVHCTED